MQKLFAVLALLPALLFAQIPEALLAKEDAPVTLFGSSTSGLRPVRVSAIESACLDRSSAMFIPSTHGNEAISLSKLEIFA